MGFIKIKSGSKEERDYHSIVDKLTKKGWDCRSIEAELTKKGYVKNSSSNSGKRNLFMKKQFFSLLMNPISMFSKLKQQLWNFRNTQQKKNKQRRKLAARK